MYALNLNNENRILSACVVLPNGDYTDMPIVNALPKGDITDYLFVNGQYEYVPLPKPDSTPTITETERLEAIEMAIAELASEVYRYA